MSHNSIFSRMTLKDLLQNPDLQYGSAAINGVPSQKAKKTREDESAETDFTSAFLGPQLWEKTCNSDDIDLEYMDLDEFLSENLKEVPAVESATWGKLLSVSPPQHHHSPQSVQSPQGSPGALGSSGCYRSLNQQSTTPSPHLSPSTRYSPAPGLHPSACVSPSPRVGFGPRVSPPSNVAPGSGSLALTGSSSAHTAAVHPVRTGSSSNLLVSSNTEDAVEQKRAGAKRSLSPGAASSASTPPVSPLPVQVDFRLSEQDLVLSSIPGQNTFDPTSHTFTEDELKPQPIAKKSRKIFVPEDLKDDRYWVRRNKNNVAAKRSRDARRVKENQIAMRASYLEKGNHSIRDEIEKMRSENATLKHRLNKFEP